MRTGLTRFLDTGKLAALILAAAIVAWMVISVFTPARAEHNTDFERVVAPISICRTPDAVAIMFTIAEGRKHYWTTQIATKICFNTAGRVRVRVHGVVGEGVWLGDGLDDQMVIIEVFDGTGLVGYTWTTKVDWEARTRLKPSGFSV